jgi:hypothetical protein
LGVGRAYGLDSEYQIFCRDVLIKEYPELVAFNQDGIDVSFDLQDTTWTFDIALKSLSGALVVAECRRWGSNIKQGQIAEFAYKVERLRKYLQIPVAGFFFAKTSYQKGAIKVGEFNGITTVELNEGQTLSAFRITYLRYEVSREKKLKRAVYSYQGKLGFELKPKSNYEYIPPQKGKKKK